MNREETDCTTVSAVVRAADGVRFVAVGRSADEVAKQLVDYIWERSDDVLWPCDASRVRTLIDAGDFHGAIGEYFEHVGARWDEERLEHVGAEAIAFSRGAKSAEFLEARTAPNSERR